MRPWTAQHIEGLVASHFGYRHNLIVPNVSWGWGLRHEADLIVLRPSGCVEEVEIKVTAGDIRADARKLVSHFAERRIRKLWFAVPEALALREEIPWQAGILALCWRPDRHGFDLPVIETRRAPWLCRDARHATDAERQKLAELGCMRVWSLKASLDRLALERSRRA